MKRAKPEEHWIWLIRIGMIALLCIFLTKSKQSVKPTITQNMTQTDEIGEIRETIETREQDKKKESNEIDVIKQIAITFDDGPHEIYTPKLLDGLAERKVHATFFVTGQNAEAYPELVKRMDEEGHLIGNHTYHHIQLTNCNGEQFYEELKKTNEVIKQITGKDTEYVRPPFGSWNKRYEQQLNMFPVLWTIDPMDWCSNDTECIVRHVLKKAEDNAIILLHDEYSTSVSAALQIIDQLQKQGYQFVTVEEILVD